MENNIELIFCNYSEKDSVNHEDKNSELFILTPSKMTDNGFKRRFNVYHYNDSDLKKNPTHIGMVKVYNSNLDPMDHNVCEQIMRGVKKYKEQNRDFPFVSIGANLHFYYNLQDKFKNSDIAMRFLNKINDISNKQNRLEDIDLCYLNEKELFGKLVCKCKGELNVLNLINVATFSDSIGKLYPNSRNKWGRFFQAYIENEDKNDKDRLYLSLVYVKALYKDYNAQKYENSSSLIINLYQLLVDYIGNTEIEKTIIKIIGINKNDNNLKKALCLIDKIQEILSVSDIKNMHNLYQYTSVKSIPYLIRRNNHSLDNQLGSQQNYQETASLRFTNANQMNDPIEGKLLIEVFNLSDRDTDYKLSDFYISSATSVDDSLPLWKQYADEGKGVCLEYDSKYLQDLLADKDDAVSIYRECYIDIDPTKKIDDWSDVNIKVASWKKENENHIENIEHKIADYLNELNEYIQKLKESAETHQAKELTTLRIFLNAKIGYLFKRIDYSYEKEFRISLYRRDKPELITWNKDDEGAIKLYTYVFNDEEEKMLVKYTRVILGPRVNDIDYIAPYIKLCDQNINVETSRIKYR